MHMRFIRLGMLALTLAAASIHSSAAPPRLRFATYGGTYLEGQKSYIGAPFEMLTGAKVEWIGGTGEISASKLIVGGGKSPPYSDAR